MSQLDTYNSSPPIAILERTKQVDNLTLNVGSIFTFDPFESWKELPEVKQYTKNYEYIRTDMKIRIVPRTTPFQYGIVIVGWFYGNDIPESISEIISANSYLLDISSSEGVEFTIPYASEFDFMCARANPGNFRIAHVAVSLIAANTTIAGGTINPEMNVFFTPENLMLAGLTQGQSGLPTHITSPYERPYAAAAAMGAMTATAGVYAMDYTVRAAASGVMSAANGFGSMIYGRPEEKVDDGKQTSVRQSYFGDLASTRPNPGGNSLTCNTDVVLLDPKQLNDDAMVHYLKDVMKLPSGPSFAFDFTNANKTAIYPIGFPNFVGWQSFLVPYFRYIRGSVRMILHFATSPLITSSFRIEIDYGTSPAPSSSFNAPTKIVQVSGSVDVIVDIPYINAIRLLQMYSTPTANFNRFATLYISMITDIPVPASGVTPHIYMFPTESYLDDFQAFSLQGRTVGQSSLREQHASPFVGDMGGSLACKVGVTHEVVTIEQIARRFADINLPSFEDIDPYPFLGSKTAFEDSANVDQLSTLFAYVRGSIEYRFGFNRQTLKTLAEFWMEPSTMTTAGTSNRTANGTVVYRVDLWPVVDVTVPWIASHIVTRTTRNYGPNYLAHHLKSEFIGGDIVIVERAYKRAGESYQFFFLNKVPLKSRWTAVTINGLI